MVVRCIVHLFDERAGSARKPAPGGCKGIAMTENASRRLLLSSQPAQASAAAPATAPDTGETPRPGGPRTAEGKLVSRGNALTHGLTATTLLPDALQSRRLAAFLCLFRDEYRPVTPSEQVLVAELARHSAALELAEAAEWAVLRQGARELGAIALGATNCPDERDEALLAAAVTSEPLDLLSRYRRAHEKAFLAALGKLRELRAAKRGTPHRMSERTPTPFAAEADCARYLEARLRRADFRCPHCGHNRGSWLASRARWQCGGCKRQLGLRTGTVMAGSRLPLVKWFRAVRTILLDPDISTAELSEKTGITRAATARQVAAKIRAALATPNVTELLAGLDHYFLTNSRTC